MSDVTLPTGVSRVAGEGVRCHRIVLCDRKVASEGRYLDETCNILVIISETNINVQSCSTNLS